MKRSKSVFLTTILTMALIALISFVFFCFFVPKYNISEASIYSALIKIVPICIILFFLQLVLVITCKDNKVLSDKKDELPPNSYPNMFHSVNDDPSILNYSRSNSETIVKEVPFEVIIGSSAASISEDTIKELTFDELLANEINNSKEYGYSLTLAYTNEKYENDDTCYSFINDDETALIFPFATSNEVQKYLKDINFTLATYSNEMSIEDFINKAKMHN